MFVVPISQLSAHAHKQTDARDRKSGHTALTLLKQSRCDYNPVTSTQPCKPGKERVMCAKENISREGIFCVCFSHLKVSQINTDGEDTAEF